MPRVLVCLDETPSPDGSCAQQGWQDVSYSFFPEMPAADGAVISFAIVGVWTLGLIARLVIRATQQQSREFH